MGICALICCCLRLPTPYAGVLAHGNLCVRGLLQDLHVTQLEAEGSEGQCYTMEGRAHRLDGLHESVALRRCHALHVLLLPGTRGSLTHCYPACQVL